MVCCYIAPPCTENEVRLMKDQVQICHNEVWGYVCSRFGWTDDDASVVCKELGFTPHGKIIIQLISATNHNHFYFITDAVGLSLYVSSFETFPFFLGGPHCSGSEEHLIDCPLSEIRNITACYETSGVHCAGTK